MQKLQIGIPRHTEVIVMDEPGAGGACHEYRVDPVQGAAYQVGAALKKLGADPFAELVTLARRTDDDAIVAPKP